MGLGLALVLLDFDVLELLDLEMEVLKVVPVLADGLVLVLLDLVLELLW